MKLATTTAAWSWIAFWRWRRASMAAALSVAAVLLTINIAPTGFRQRHGGNDQYGWPCRFVEAYTNDGSLLSLRKAGVIGFEAKNLAFDALVSLTISLAAGVWFQYRLRDGRKKACQFTLNELLVAGVVFAAALAWIVHQDRWQEAALKRLRCGFAVKSPIPYSIHRWLPYMPGGWLKPLDRVTYLDIVGGERRDDDFEPLSQFADVEELVIEADFTDGALRFVAGIPCLAHLRLASPRLTGEGFADLLALPRLRSLQLSMAGLSEEGFHALSRLSATDVCIELHDTTVSAACIQRLAQLPQLSSLTLTRARLDTDARAALGSLRQIRRLHLATITLSDDAAPLQRTAALDSTSLAGDREWRFKAVERLRARLPDCFIDWD